MAKKRKIVQEDEDGTPIAIVEVDEADDAPAETATVEAEPEPPAPEPAVEPEIIPEPEPQNAAVEGSRRVTWTKKGEEAGVWSEHGRAVEGQTIDTTFAEMFVERGYVTEAK